MNSKTILHRALLVMLLAILGAGCAPPDPANDPSHGSAPAQERREGKLILTAKLDGAAVVAVLTRETLCRDRIASARGRRSPPSSWEPCGTSPVAGAQLELGMNTPTKLVQTTNGEGTARFDLSAVEPTPELVRKQQAGVFAQGSVAPAMIDLSTCPLMAGWKETVATAAATAAASAQARQQESLQARDAECASGKAMSCFRLGTNERDPEVALRYLRRACDLKFQPGCAAAQELLSPPASPQAPGAAATDSPSARLRSVGKFRGMVHGMAGRDTMTLNLKRGENAVRIKATSKIGCLISIGSAADGFRQIMAKAGGDSNECSLSVTAKAAVSVNLEVWRAGTQSDVSYEGELFFAPASQ